LTVVSDDGIVVGHRAAVQEEKTMPEHPEDALSLQLSQIHVHGEAEYQVTLDATYPKVPEVTAFFVIRCVRGPAGTTTLEHAQRIAEGHVREFSRGLLDKLESAVVDGS
jgi:hypothetical protein